MRELLPLQGRGLRTSLTQLLVSETRTVVEESHPLTKKSRIVIISDNHPGYTRKLWR